MKVAENMIYNDFQLIKREFFALRNGIVADNLRRAGAPYRIIFGLNLPQLTEMARRIGENRDIAERLWANSTTRESLLLAPMVFPKLEMTLEIALKWVNEAPSAEVVDVLCHRLLRHLSCAGEIPRHLIDDNRDLSRYAALRLMLNLLPDSLNVAGEAARKELSRDCKLTAIPAMQLLDEISFAGS